MVRVIKGMLRVAAAVGTVAAVGVLVYRNLLTDEAKESLRSGVTEVRNTVETINKTLCDEADERAAAEINRRRTQMQWEELGY